MSGVLPAAGGAQAAQAAQLGDQLAETRTALAGGPTSLSEATAGLGRISELEAAGVTIVQPDVAAFRQATLAAVPPKFEAKWGKGTYESIATMK